MRVKPLVLKSRPARTAVKVARRLSPARPTQVAECDAIAKGYHTLFRHAPSPAAAAAAAAVPNALVEQQQAAAQDADRDRDHSHDHDGRQLRTHRRARTLVQARETLSRTPRPTATRIFGVQCRLRRGRGHSGSARALAGGTAHAAAAGGAAARAAAELGGRDAEGFAAASGAGQPDLHMPWAGWRELAGMENSHSTRAEEISLSIRECMAAAPQRSHDRGRV